jgi:ABC-2 type transport system ATP-binding protein
MRSEMVVPVSTLAVRCTNLRIEFTKNGFLPGRKGRCVEALKGVTFDIPEGDVFGILGPNGAGKTTLMRVLATLIVPASGQVAVGGFDVVREAKRVRELIGLAAGSERSFYYRLTGEQNLRFFAAAQGIPPRTARTRISELLGFFDLVDASDRQYMTYSTGMRRKLLIARALLHDPEIVILDEPTASLDPVSAKKLRSKITEMNQADKTIILSTHYLGEAEELCPHISLLKEGLIIAQGSPRSIIDSIGERSVLKLVISNFREEVLQESTTSLWEVDYDAKMLDPPIGLAELRVLYRKQQDVLPELVRTLVSHDVRILSLEDARPTLEDAFLRLSGGV